MATPLEASAVESIDREEGGAPFADFFLQIHHVDWYDRPAHEIHVRVVDATQKALDVLRVEAGYLKCGCVCDVCECAGMRVRKCACVRVCGCTGVWVCGCTAPFVPLSSLLRSNAFLLAQEPVERKRVWEREGEWFRE